MKSIQAAMVDAEEQEVVLVPLVFPIGVFKKMNELAMKEKKTFVRVVTEALMEKVEKLAAKQEKDEE